MPVSLKVHLLIFITIATTVYAQLAVKKQMAGLGSLPEGLLAKLGVLFAALVSPWVFTAIVAIFLGALCWMSILTILTLSYAYPFMSLTFILVPLASMFFFNEPFSWNRIVGALFIVAGLCISSFFNS